MDESSIFSLSICLTSSLLQSSQPSLSPSSIFLKTSFLFIFIYVFFSQFIAISALLILVFLFFHFLNLNSTTSLSPLLLLQFQLFNHATTPITLPRQLSLKGFSSILKLNTKSRFFFWLAASLKSNTGTLLAVYLITVPLRFVFSVVVRHRPTALTLYYAEFLFLIQ